MPSFAPEPLAICVWGQVHGVISLALEGQISHTVPDRFSLCKIILFGIDQTGVGEPIFVR